MFEEHGISFINGVLPAHSEVNLFRFDLVSGVVADDLEEPGGVKELEGLGDAHLDLAVPRVHLGGLPLVRNVEDVEALLEVEDLAQAFEVDEEQMEGLLVEENALSPALAFERIGPLELPGVHRDGVVEQNLLHHIVLLDHLLHRLLYSLPRRLHDLVLLKYLAAFTCYSLLLLDHLAGVGEVQTELIILDGLRPPVDEAACGLHHVEVLPQVFGNPPLRYELLVLLLEVLQHLLVGATCDVDGGLGGPSLTLF